MTESESKEQAEPIIQHRLIDLGESIVEVDNIGCIDKCYWDEGWFFNRSRTHGLEIFYSKDGLYKKNEVRFNSESDRDSAYVKLIFALDEIGLLR